MKKFEKEILQSQIDAEKAVLKQLEQNYQQAVKDIDDKVAALLGRADADTAHVIYQVEYQRQLKTQVQSILEQLQANEFETISEYLTQCYEEGFMGSLYSMQQQGVPLAFPINQEQVVMALQTDSKISEGLYTRLGKDIGELKKNISAEIARGISTSLPYAQIAKNLDRQAQIGMNRAMRITRTEGGRIQNKAAMDTMFKAKGMGADVVKRWSAALDARTRDSHAKIDGEVKEIEEKFSNGLMYPKDPSGKASEVVNCRCKVQERARWALTANQTKMLGNTKNMTDEQKEAIAKRLGIPVEDLDQYSGQIVPINAKNYADFKRQYKEIWNYEGSDLQKEANARIAGYKSNKGAATTQSKPVFTHAKTIEEAEEYGRRFIVEKTWSKNGNISYKGLSIDSANKFNETLTELYDRFDIPKLQNLQPMPFREKRWKSHKDAVLAYDSTSQLSGGLFYNPNFVKTQAGVSQYVADGKNAYDVCVRNVHRLTGKNLTMVETYAKAGRSLVVHDTEDYLQSFIQHEMGHHIHQRMMVYDPSVVEVVKNGFENHAINISGYATKSFGEYIAESFCAFNNGEADRIDPALKDYFEGLMK